MVTINFHAIHGCITDTVVSHFKAPSLRRGRKGVNTKAEECLFSSIDEGINNFFETNPTDEDINNAKEYLSLLLNDKAFDRVQKLGIKYALTRLGVM